MRVPIVCRESVICFAIGLGEIGGRGKETGIGGRPCIYVLLGGVRAVLGLLAELLEPAW